MKTYKYRIVGLILILMTIGIGCGSLVGANDEEEDDVKIEMIDNEPSNNEKDNEPVAPPPPVDP